MAYQERKKFRYNLLKKEFDANYPIDMNAGHVSFSKTINHLTDLIDKKKEDASERNRRLESARAKTASLDPALTLTRTIQAYEQEHIKDEYDKLMERYRRGDHIFKNPAKEMLNEVDLETTMHLEAASLFGSSQSLDELKSTVVQDAEAKLLPQNKTLLSSINYIKNTKDKLDSYRKYKFYKDKIQASFNTLMKLREERGTLLTAIEKHKEENVELHDFDLLLSLHNKIRDLNSQIAVEEEDIENSKVHAASLEKEMSQLYPELNTTVANFSASRVNDDADTRAYGWIIGRMNELGQITCMLFGQFTLSNVVPGKDWIYIGQNVKQDQIVESQKNLLNDYYVDESNMQKMTHDDINVTTGLIATAVKQKPNSVKSIKITGCSLQEVNGRYLQHGEHCGAEKFQNVNGYCVFRHSMGEIPELGIFASTCYSSTDKSESFFNKIAKRSDEVFNELLQPNCDALDGTAKFKRMFAEISRTSSRMVTADHQMHLIRGENLKASVRMKADEELLLMIAAASQGDFSTEPLHTEANFNTVTDLSSFPEINVQSSNQVDNNLTNKTGVDGIENLDFKVLMSKNIEYQIGSQAMLVKGVNEKNESELSNDVLRFIERREIILEELRQEAMIVEQKYFLAQEESIIVNPEKALDRIFELCDQLRIATVDVAESIGAWARYLNKSINKYKKNNTLLTKGGNTRRYCVAIAVKGDELYPLSMEMKSSHKRFSRGMEQRKLATKIEYVGEYPDKQSALEAFHRACTAVPLEKHISTDISSNNYFLGLRSCGNHYLVRNEGVPSSLKCEACAQETIKRSDKFVPKVTGMTFPQFIWHGNSYLEKMWTDSMFLNKVSLLSKYHSDIQLQLNPLILPKSQFSNLLSKTIVANNEDMTTEYNRAALSKLKGRFEEVQNAIKNARFVSTKVVEYDKTGLPYVMPGVLPNLEADYQYSETSNFVKSSNFDREVAPLNPFGLVNTSVAVDDMTISSSITVADSMSNAAISTDFTNSFIRKNIDDRRLQLALLILGQSHYLENLFSTDSEFVDDRASLMQSNEDISRESMGTKAKTSSKKTMKRSIQQSKSATHLENTIPTVTRYSHLGATLQVVQHRKPVAYREDNIWCRSDVGEWAGLQTKGRAMRAWESRDRKETEAKKRIALRMQLQKQIRHELSFQFEDCNVSRIKELIYAAEEHRGSMLDLDVMTAHQYLDQRKAWIHSAIKIQSCYRGSKGRLKAKFIIREKWFQHNMRLCLEEEGHNLAKACVADILHLGVKNVTKKLTSPLFTLSNHCGGVPYIVSIYKCTRGISKTLNLCPACQNNMTKKIYGFQTHTETSIRIPCTCILVQGPELWSIRLYDPISSEILERTLPADTIKEFILRNCRQANSKYTSYSLLYGDDFDVLEPLMSNFNQNANQSAAYFDASRENSVVSRKVTRVSTLLDEYLTNLQLPSHIVELFKKHAIAGGNVPLTLSTMRSRDSFITLSDDKSAMSWQPLSQLIHYSLFAKLIPKVLPEMESYAQFAYNSWKDKNNELLLFESRDYEWSQMEFEDGRSSYLQKLELYTVALKRFNDAVAFSKAMKQTTTEEEQQIRTNWTRSWEVVENGNQWIGISEVNRIKNILEEHEANLKSLHASLCEKAETHRRLQNQTAVAKKLTETDKGIMENFKRFIAQCQESLAIIRSICLESIKFIVSTIAVPGIEALPTTRHIHLVENDLTFIRKCSKRAGAEYRSGWNIIARKVKVLRVQRGFQSSIDHKVRCIVTIYEDPLSKGLIVAIDGNESNALVTEEMMMHQYYGHHISTYSENCTYCNISEIIVNDADLKHDVLHKSCVWPEDIPRIRSDLLNTSKENQSDRNNILVARQTSGKSRSTWIETPLCVASSVEALTTSLYPGRVGDDSVAVSSVDQPGAEEKCSLKIYSYCKHQTKLFPVGNYAQRRKYMKQNQTKFVGMMLTYLRLNPHSMNPTLGLLQLKRRVAHLQNLFQHTLWYNDILKYFPNGWINEVCWNKRSIVVNRELNVCMRESWGRLVVKLKTCNGEDKFSGYYALAFVKFLDIVRSLIHEPIMLCAYLCESIVNNFSLDTMAYISNRLSVTLPGENNLFFRKSFQYESPPAFYYVSLRDELYRGPAYSTHRFVSGKYCFVQVFKSWRGDLKIVLNKPTNGEFEMFTFTQYSEFVIYLSIESIKLFVVKKAFSIGGSNVIVRELILSLMHPLHFHDLITILLNCVTINDTNKDDDSSFASSEGSVTLGQVSNINFSAMDHAEDEEDINLDDFNSYSSHSWNENLVDVVTMVIKCFNLWTKTHAYPFNTIDKKLMKECVNALRALTKDPVWVMNNDATVMSPTENILVCETLWRALDPRRVSKLKDTHILSKYSTAQNAAEDSSPEKDAMNMNRRISNFVAFKKENQKAQQLDDEDDEDFLFLTSSYWKANLKTDEAKSLVAVEIRESKLEDLSAQHEVALVEQENMGKEDIASHKRAEVVKQLQEVQFIERQRRNKMVISQKLVSEVQHISNERDAIKAEVSEFLSNISMSLDALFDKLGLCSYKLSIDAMNMTYVNTSIHFDIDEKLLRDLIPDDEEEMFSSSSFSLFRDIDLTEEDLEMMAANKNSLNGDPTVVSIKQFFKVLLNDITQMKCFTLPTILCVASNVTTRAKKSTYHERSVNTSAIRNDITIRSQIERSEDSSSSPNTFRTMTSWRRQHLESSWEVGPLKKVDPGFFKRARKVLKPRLVSHRNRFLCLSAPTIGPFDFSSQDVYDTNNQKGYRVLFKSNIKLPALSGFEQLHDLGSDQRNSSSHADATVILAKECAERIVWKSLVYGTSSAIVHSIHKVIDAKCYMLQNRVVQSHAEVLSDHYYHKNVSYQEGDGVVELYRYVGRLPHPILHEKQMIISSVFVSAKEDTAPFQFHDSRSCTWLEQTLEHLNCHRMSDLHRIMTVPALVYVSKQSIEQAKSGNVLHNLRVSRWIYEFIDNFGWRSGVPYADYMKYLAREKKSSHYKKNPVIVGDAVLIFRLSQHDLHQFVTWCKNRYEENLALIERRARKDRDDSRRRNANYDGFRNRIFDLAAEMLPIFEQFFYGNSKAPLTILPEFSKVSMISPKFFHFRAMLSQYLRFQVQEPQNQAVALNLMNKSFVLLKKAVYTRFENFIPEASPIDEEYLQYNWNTFDNPDDLRPQAVQVLFAMYSLHCSNCAAALGNCPVLGCRQIRQCVSCLPDDDNESGLNGVEAAIHQFLTINGELFSNCVLPTNNQIDYSLTKRRSSEDQLAIEEENDVDVVNVKTSSRLKWRSVLEMGKLLRYVNRRVVPSSMKYLFDGQELLEAKGGHDHREEAVLPYDSISSYSRFLPPVTIKSNPGKEEASLSQHIQQKDNDSLASHSLLSVSVSQEELHKEEDKANLLLPLSFIKPMHRHLEMDPCPRGMVTQIRGADGGSDDEDTTSTGYDANNVMPQEMYQWIMKRTLIFRESSTETSLLNSQLHAHDPAGQPQSQQPPPLVQDVNVDEDSSYTVKLKFDRLYREEIITLSDGASGILTILHGLVDMSNIRFDTITEVDAKLNRRFLTSEDMKHVGLGMTVLVYDTKSDVTKRIIIRQKDISRLCKEYLIDNEQDYSVVADMVVKHASKLIQIKRMDGIFVEASLQSSAPQSSLHSLPPPTQAKSFWTQINSRVVVYNRPAALAHYAAELLEELECMDVNSHT